LPEKIATANAAFQRVSVVLRDTELRLHTG
jgi:hypothetical protein